MSFACTAFGLPAMAPAQRTPASAAVAWPSWPPWLRDALRMRSGAARAPRPLELRIDVSPSPEEIDRDIDAVHERLYEPGSPLYGMPATESGIPGLRLRYREADGEYYIYVEDVARRRLAGYTVFNRLIEVSRRADRHLRAPHSKYAPAYQRRGLASAIYRWGLDAGLCLVTGARQSSGAHALWMALGARYTLGYVDLRGKTLRYLGDTVTPAVLDDLHTRMILLGNGWTLASLADVTGMR